MSVRGELRQTTDETVHIFPLAGPRVTIGRGKENSLCLPDHVVSRYHAELIRLGNDFLLRDTGSRNGSYVNGVRVAEQMLNDGDLLSFGSAGPELVFRRVEEAGSDEPVAAPRHWDRTADLIESLSGKLEVISDDSPGEANLRCLLAEARLNQGAHDAALEVIGKYAEPAGLRALPREQRAAALLWLGRVYLERKQHDLALNALERSLNFYTQAGDDQGVAGAHASFGRALLNTGDLLSARDSLQRALLAARRAGSARLRAEAHLLLGKVDWKEGDFEGARYNWTRAARLAEGLSDPLLAARLGLQQALLLHSEGKLQEAVSAYQKVIEQIAQVGNVRLLLKAYSSLARVLMRLGSWAAAERLLADRLRLAREHDLRKAEAVALTDLAEFRFLRGETAEAAEVIKAALRRHGETVYARTQRILGRILAARGSRAEAVEALARGLEAARAKGALEEQVLIGLELALVRLEGGDPQGARAALEAAESITSLDPALNLMARALYTRGALEAAAGQAAEAGRSFTQSLSIFQTIGDPFRAGLCEAAIGALRARSGRFESARAHLEEARRVFARLGARAELRRVEEQLAADPLARVKAALTRPVAALSLTAPLSMAGVSHKPPEATAAPPAPRRVLVAAASEELAGMLARGLEVENYAVDRVADGGAALARAFARDGGYSCLLLDALLEHRSGFDVCRELRRHRLETPVILLGGRHGLEDKIEALQAGADDFLSKRNMAFEELMAKMEALLR